MLQKAQKETFKVRANIQMVRDYPHKIPFPISGRCSNEIWVACAKEDSKVVFLLQLSTTSSM